jgi:hypothetical protein
VRSRLDARHWRLLREHGERWRAELPRAEG